MAAKKQTKQPAKGQKGHDLYVGLLEPDAMQRELLEARKNALVLLKRFEKVMLMRDQRLYLEGELREAISELSRQMDGIMSSFPELPEEEVAKAKAAAPVSDAAKKPRPTGGQMSEIDRKLAAIDERLAGLEK